MRHHIYALLASVMADALDRELIPENPCRVRHAGGRTAKRSRHAQKELIAVLSTVDVATLAEAMPKRHQALGLLLAFSGLRPGEALALTRKDLRHGVSRHDVPRWTVRVTKALSKGGVGPTKTPESIRTVPLPPHLAVPLEQHLDPWAAKGEDGPLFPSRLNARTPASLCQVTGSSGTSKGAGLDRLQRSQGRDRPAGVVAPLRPPAMGTAHVATSGLFRVRMRKVARTQARSRHWSLLHPSTSTLSGLTWTGSRRKRVGSKDAGRRRRGQQRQGPLRRS